MNTTPFTIGPAYKSHLWHAIRLYYPKRDPPIVFGSSDAASLVGVSPYRSPLELYMLCAGLIEQPPPSEAMSLGTRLEKVILDEYGERTGNALVLDMPMLISADHKHLGASLDAAAIEDDYGNLLDGSHWLHVVKVKNTTSRMTSSDGLADPHKFGEEGTDQVPTSCLLQVQQQMLVSGLDAAEFAVLVDGTSFRTYRVAADSLLQEVIVRAAAVMLDRLKDGRPPEPNWEMEGTKQLLADLFGYAPEKKVQLDPKTTALWEQSNLVAKRIKELEKERDAYRNQVLWQMEDAECALLQGTDREIRRVKASETNEAREKVGQVKRNGYDKLIERKVR